METAAPVRINMRKVKIRLFVTLGAKCVLLANLTKYLVISLSKIIAIIEIMAIAKTVDKSTPKKNV